MKDNIEQESLPSWMQIATGKKELDSPKQISNKPAHEPYYTWKYKELQNKIFSYGQKLDAEERKEYFNYFKDFE